MFDKKKVQEALNRIDSLLSKARIVDPVLSRLDHIQLVQDMRMLNECCMEYFEDQTEKPKIVRLEDERADIDAEHVESCDQDQQGSGDSVSGD